MLSKRGLSDVVTTVLIVLVALGAIGIIAGFLLPAIQSGSSQITASCLTLQLEPVKCTYTEANVATVLVKRNTGDSDLQGVTLVFTNSNGETESNITTINPNILETKSVVASLADEPKSVQVSGTVLTEAGDEKICQLSRSVDCTAEVTA